MDRPLSARRALARSEPSPTPRLGALERLALASGAWVFVYLFVQGEDGFFARTADRVDALWIKLTVLDVPLHLALTIALLGCLAARTPTWRRVGLVIGWVNLALIAAHVALSVATA